MAPKMGRLLSFDGGNDGYEHLGFVYKVLCFILQKTNMMALEKKHIFSSGDVSSNGCFSTVIFVVGSRGSMFLKLFTPFCEKI